MLAVLSSFAQEERRREEKRSISENMKWTFKKKFLKGELYFEYVLNGIGA